MAKRKLFQPVTALLALASMTAAIFTGCSMCCGPHDFDYPTFGGKFERVDRQWGRVGSSFSDPNVVPGLSADSNLQPHEEGDDPARGMLDDPNSNGADPPPENGTDILPDPNRIPSPDEEPTASRPWPTKPLRGQWR